MAVDIYKTRNPLRRLITGTWYNARNEQGERILWIPYTSFLGGRLPVKEWLDLIDSEDVEANLQLSFDRWNFGPANELDFKMLKLMQEIQKGSIFHDNAFLEQQMMPLPWTRPLGIMRNISLYMIGFLILMVAWCLDQICEYSPDWVEDKIEKFFMKILGKF